MKPKSLVFAAGLLACISCKQSSDPHTRQNVSGINSFKEHVAISHAGIRSIDSKTFVREMTFKHFGDFPTMPAMIHLDEVAFTDDGTGSDLKANDGTYTSLSLFFHNDEVPFDATSVTRATLVTPIINPAFKHLDALRSQKANYAFTGAREAINEITCEVEISDSECDSENTGWCKDCCVTIHADNCAITFGS